MLPSARGVASTTKTPSHLSHTNFVEVIMLIFSDLIFPISTSKDSHIESAEVPRTSSIRCNDHEDQKMILLPVGGL